MMRVPTLLALCLFLTGCSLTPTAAPTAQTGIALLGKVHGGQQPVVGAHVYLLAANTTAYGAASLSLLTSATGHADTLGNYVLTDANGSFSITGDYTCTANTQVYLYALGGNPGAGSNNASGLLAALGTCTSLTPSTFIWINEVSTIAAAYAFAGFATDATHVSSSGSALAQTGIANAFANAANLASLSNGTALANNPAGTATAPQATVNTLANILTSCVNSNGSVSGPTNPTACYTLFNNAQSAGSSGTIPTDTATAAINIAHNPGMNLALLYGLATPAVSFAPALSAPPNDFTLGLQFSGGGMYISTFVAIDAAGDAWISNTGGNGHAGVVTEISPSGTFLSGPNGVGSVNAAYGIAIDSSGNAWISDVGDMQVEEILANRTGVFTFASGQYPNEIAISGTGNLWFSSVPFGGRIQELSSSGSLIFTSSGGAGGLASPEGLAIDGSGDVWVSNHQGGQVSQFSNTGSAISPVPGYTGGGLSDSHGVAIDSAGHAWVANIDNLVEFSHAGTILSGTNGFTGGGINTPYGIAIDGAGNVWLANLAQEGASPIGFFAVSEFAQTGTAISPARGYYAGNTMQAPISVAIDGSGNVWVANFNAGYGATELIGAATPVITPIGAGLPMTPTADGSSSVGTRP